MVGVCTPWTSVNTGQGLLSLGSWLLSTRQHTAVCNLHGTDFCKWHEVRIQFHFVSQIDIQHYLSKRLQLFIFLLTWNVTFASFRCICVYLYIHHSNVYVCIHIYIKYFPKSSYFHNNLLKNNIHEWVDLSLRSLFCSSALFVCLYTTIKLCLQVHSQLWYPVDQVSPALFLKNVLAHLSPLHFYVPFSTSLSASTKTNKNINKYPWDSYWD